MSVKCPQCGATIELMVKSSVPTRNETPPIFPEPYAKMLTVTDEGNDWKVQAKEYIHNKDDFKNIAEIVRQFGGEYISAGRDSHFKIPK